VTGACVIEHSLYFVLGFCLATLLALAVLPAFWRRAYRLTRREVEATLPLSPREIAAERDQLRAKFAVERLQMEQKINEVSVKRHEDMKQTGQKTVTIAELDNTIHARNNAIQALTTTREQQTALQNVTQSALEDVRSNLAQRTSDLQTLTGIANLTQSELDAATALSEKLAGEIIALKANMAAQFKRVEELSAVARKFKEQSKNNFEEARISERKLRDSEKDRSILARRLETAEELATKRDTALAERDQRLSVLQEKTISITSIAKELDAARKEEARKLAQSEALLRAREEAITRVREDSALTARDLTKTIDKIRADRQKLQSELSEARAKSAILQRELNSLKRLSSVSDLRIQKPKENTIK
jgi:hypothetical protein